MGWREPQNPGLGGIDELTDSEETFVQNLAGLGYMEGDILYQDASDLSVLAIGTAGQALVVNSGATAPEWGSAGITDHGNLTGLGDVADHPDYLLVDGSRALGGDVELGVYIVNVATGGGIDFYQALGGTYWAGIAVEAENRISLYSSGSYYPILDVGGITIPNKIFTFPDVTGTFITSGNLSDITHGNLTGLSDDDHTQYVLDNILTTKGDIFAATAADTPTRLAVGANDDVLTADSGEATGMKWASVSAGGQTLYDAIVDAGGGGDYTSIVTACATEAIGATIFIRTGTYVETADIVMKNEQSLIGEDRKTVIIDFDNVAYQINAVSLAGGVQISNLQVINSIDTNGAVYVNACPFSRIDNLIIKAGSTKTTGINGSSDDSIISNCYISGFTGTGHYSINFQGSRCRIRDNRLKDGNRNIRISGSDTVVTGNVLSGSSRDAILVGGTGGGAVIAGNQITVSSNDGVDCNGGSVTIVGNKFSQGTGVRIGLYSNNIITGNRFISSNILLGTGGNNTIVGNYFSDGNGVLNVSSAVNHGNVIMNNRGANPLLESNSARMKNTSGVSLAEGDIVVFKAIASISASYEVATTTVQGDDMIFGMVQETIADNAFGYIQTLGGTIRLKVNGLVDIAVGDFIGTHTDAGIGMKAASGDMAFAIALEVYTTDDSAGVIDALLITPRKI